MISALSFICILSSVLFATTGQAKEPEKHCVDWFNRAKLLSHSKECKTKCITLITDMSTFMCPEHCDKLCAFEANDLILANLVFYPGLTREEKELVARNPKVSFSVYRLKLRAEDATNRNFPSQDLSDESDAFRHFVWAGLLTRELGRQNAKKYLDAHESNPLQSDLEKEMDVYNNERGQEAAEKLIQSNNWSEKALEAKAIEELQGKKLKVIKPGLPIPKEPK